MRIRIRKRQSMQTGVAAYNFGFLVQGQRSISFFSVEELITSVECMIDRGVILSYNQVIKQ